MKTNKNYKIIIILLVLLVTITLGLISILQRPRYPNIILITVDALRPDHLGCYGYQRNTSPNIDKLAKEGVIFRECFATSSGTGYASPGLFTGRYLGLKNISPRELLSSDTVILDKKFNTLAEYLKRLGYYTGAFSSSNFFYRTGSGFEQGFDIYNNSIEGAKALSDEIIDFLNNYSGNNPFFIWVHYMDPHIPYSPPEEYFKIFVGDRLYKKNDKILKLRSKEHPLDTICGLACASFGYIPPAAFHAGKYNLNYYIAYYDAEIRYTDFHIGRLLKNIKEDTFIIFTADHGEALGEHNIYFAHGENIYDEVLHIPLVIKDTRFFKGGKRIPTVISSVDIVPTILSRINHLRYFFNKNNFNGVDLKIIAAGQDIKRKYVYSYFPWVWSIRDVERNIKYIFTLGRKEELYFLPDEYTNRINDGSSEAVQIKEELKKELKTWLNHYPIRADINPREKAIDDQTKELLRFLGYLQ